MAVFWSVVFGALFISLLPSKVRDVVASWTRVYFGSVWMLVCYIEYLLKACLVGFVIGIASIAEPGNFRADFQRKKDELVEENRLRLERLVDLLL